jgi:UTP-glucose-1-phosphate uridylyltransferase
MGLTLLVLAAGMGSRFGGLKQIEPVGPNGETILDYATFDAMRAGFERVVFVIRQEFAALFQEQIGAKYSGSIQVAYVYQSSEALPDGATFLAKREKPWGTGHAVWCARDAIGENFAVINADDFYGADSFARLAGFLRQARGSQFAMVGFELAKTLSEHGAVSRGICTVAEDGRLRSVVERQGIERSEVGRKREYLGSEIVSMNCWGFTPDIFPALEEQFKNFLVLSKAAPEAQREFYLPAAVSDLVARGHATVKVLPTESSWFGITYREDKVHVKAALMELLRAEKYPAKLF